MLYSLIESISLDRIVAPLPQEEVERVKKDTECAVDVVAPQAEAVAADEAEAIECLVPRNTSDTSTLPVVHCSAEELSGEVAAQGSDFDAPVATAPSPQEGMQHLKKRKKKAMLGGFWQLVAPDPNFLEEEEEEE
jgi:hypothetical protein